MEVEWQVGGYGRLSEKLLHRPLDYKRLLSWPDLRREWGFFRTSLDRRLGDHIRVSKPWIQIISTTPISRILSARNVTVGIVWRRWECTD